MASLQEELGKVRLQLAQVKGRRPAQQVRW